MMLVLRVDPANIVTKSTRNQGIMCHFVCYLFGDWLSCFVFDFRVLVSCETLLH